MRLHSLKNTKGAVHRRKRVGCGEGSGRGKTCGRGGKGQTARSGGSIRPGFEGGQMPLYRRLPQRGFNNHKFRKEYAHVNLSSLQKLEGVEEIDREVLVSNGLINANAERVKILGDGEISRAVKIKADKFSAAAKRKIEAAGGEAIAT
jgi:large subunit ribosomal protein L15